MSESPPSDENAVRLLTIARGFCGMVPHNRALGMEVVSVERGLAILRIPYDARTAGDPDTGVMHGGVITTLMDASCGMAVFTAIDEPVPIATLDLRIDYLRPAEPGRAVVTRAECYKMTRNVAFARAVAYHEDPREEIASAAGTFMISTAGGSVARDPREKGAS